MSRSGSLFWWFLPEGAEVLVIAGVALLLIVGVFSRKKAFGILGVLLLILLAEPFVVALLNVMPWWLLIPLMAVVVLSLLRTILGKRIFDEVIGHLLARVIWAVGAFSFRAAWRAVCLPFRALRWLFRGVADRRVRRVERTATQVFSPPTRPSRPNRPRVPTRPMPTGHFPRGYWDNP